MKKRFLTLILTVIATFTCGFGLVACNQGQGGGSSQSGAGAGAGEVPVYQGMTISNGQATAATAKNMSVGLMSAKTPGNTDNNGNHNGWYKGDHNDKDDHVDQENPFPDNESDENIENEIQSSLDVIGAGQEIYYATANEDVYINVHINNPDNYEIISFTLNGEKYSSYMFEKGSDMETLILKYNVGDNSGIQEYTIDAIKYIDGTEIKDVVMAGDKTVVAGIRRDDQVTATVSNLSIGFNDIALKVNVTDEDNLIEYSQGCLKAVIYDGESIVATKDLVVGNNDVTFDDLGTRSLYQYAIVGYYDAFSGEGVALNTLFKEAFYTKAIVLFDNIEISQEDIRFSFLWDNDFQNKTLTSLTLFKGEEETNLSTTAISVDGLLANTVYTLVAEYKNGEKTESISLEFKTEAKTTPVVEIANVTTTSTSVSFAINETDTENLGEITKIELVHANGIVVADSVDVREFTGLLFGNSYTIKVSYTYDLNDGLGVQEHFVETDFEASSQGLTYRSVESGWEVSGLGSCQDVDIAIPSEYNGAPVVSIGNSAFYDYDSLTSVTIGNSVNFIGEEAFYGCSNLTGVYISSIEDWCNISFASSTANPLGYAKNLYLNNELVTELKIPDSVTFIGKYAFYNCDSLTSAIVPERVASIGNYAFYNCRSLTGIKIPDSATFIGGHAFAHCGSLTSVTIGNGVTSIGDSAFEYCSSLMSVTIGDSVTSIGDSAFYRCCRVVEVVNKSPHITIEKGSWDNIYIGYYALAVYNSGDTFESKLSNDNGYIVYNDGTEKILVNYTGTETDLTLPAYITQINQYAFWLCKSLTSVVIGDSVTSIGDSAFYYCSSLTSVTIGNGVTSIGRFMFEHCNSLTSVTIGNGVTFIDEYAFNFCSSLTGVYITDIEAWCNILFESSSANPLYIGANLYLNNELVTEVEIPNTITEIKPYAFYKCTSLTSIVIPDSVTSIGKSAFSNCTALTEINYNATECADLSSNSYVFYKAGQSGAGITVTIGANVKKIPAYLFDPYGGSSDAPNITTVVFEEGSICETIGDYAFSGCSSLTSVYYKGTAEDWKNMTIGKVNSKLSLAKRYYYSETTPSVSGNYWCYGENGEIVVW